MTDDYKLYDDTAALEQHFGFPPGTLSNIPIYARMPAVDAILKVREMEQRSLFRPGLYYIVLADLRGNTAFNAKWGDAEGDTRTEWFHVCAIQTIGEIDFRNYVVFSKTIGDAVLIIFSSFIDVYEWSAKLTENLNSMLAEYEEELNEREHDFTDAEVNDLVRDFDLKARRLVHLGEVSYKSNDPLSLAVSQTFKIEKSFKETDLGCTQSVADAISPKLRELKLELIKNKAVKIPGLGERVMTYYVRPRTVEGRS